MRLEIMRSDQDEIVTKLWDALKPLSDQTNGEIMVWMTSSGGETGGKRAMVLDIKGLDKNEVKLS